MEKVKVMGDEPKIVYTVRIGMSRNGERLDFHVESDRGEVLSPIIALGMLEAAIVKTKFTMQEDLKEMFKQ
jgi:hypothetical protein